MKSKVFNLEIPFKGMPQLKIEVGYEQGGYSYFSSQVTRRGYYFYVQPANVCEHSVTTLLFDGFKILLKEVGRKSSKTLEELTKNIDSLIREHRQTIVSYYGNFFEQKEVKK